MLVGTHQGELVLLGVSKRYGYPLVGTPLDDITEVVRFPSRTLVRRTRVSRRRASGRVEEYPIDAVTPEDRFQGCLLGLAAGDTVSTALPFENPDTFEPMDDMADDDMDGRVRLGSYRSWSTEVALCLAESLIERDGFDATDQRERYLLCREEALVSDVDPSGAGQGVLIWLAPVPMYFAGDPVEAIDRSADYSRTIHGAKVVVDACRYFASLLVGALHGVDKDTLLSSGYCPVEGLWARSPFADKIAMVAEGSFKDREPPKIQGAEDVVKSLEAALWAFHNATDFRDGVPLASNLGAGCAGAIYGQIAGAHYGVEAVPWEWLAQLPKGGLLSTVADDLYEHALDSLPARK